MVVNVHYTTKFQKEVGKILYKWFIQGTEQRCTHCQNQNLDCFRVYDVYVLALRSETGL